MKPKKNKWRKLKKASRFSEIYIRKFLLNEVAFMRANLSPKIVYQNFPDEIHNIHPLIYKKDELKIGKNRKRKRNGGGERNFAYYGNFRYYTKTSRKKILENVGKSSRKYSRLKKEWWNEE